MQITNRNDPGGLRGRSCIYGGSVALPGLTTTFWPADAYPSETEAGRGVTYSEGAAMRNESKSVWGWVLIVFALGYFAVRATVSIGWSI